MRNISILLLSVSLVSSVYCLNTSNDHFCEAYQRSDQKVLIFSYREVGSLFIIGDKLWNVTTNGSDMKFESVDKPMNFVKNSPQYSYVIPGEFEGKSDQFHFYNPKTSYFNLLKRDNVTKVFKLEYLESEFPCHPKTFPKTFIISNRGERGYDFKLIGTTNEWFDNVDNRMQRTVEFVLLLRQPNNDQCLGLEYNLEKWEQAVKSIQFKQYFLDIKTIHLDLELIGVTVPALSSGSVVFVFFRNGSQILYCNIEECLKDKIKLLIDCSPYVITESPICSDIETVLCDNTNLYVTIIPLIIIILVLVIIIFWCAYTKRNGLENDKQNPAFMSIQKTDDSSIHTVDSNTGLPKNKAVKAVDYKFESVNDDSIQENQTKQLSAQPSLQVKRPSKSGESKDIEKK